MLTSSYQSDIKSLHLNEIFNYINKTIEYYQNFVNCYSTSIAYDDVMKIIDSPLSCFFNEYLARKFNPDNPVINLEKFVHNKIELKIKDHFNTDKSIIFNIGSASMAIIGSLLTLINKKDKVLILDNCCGGYWSQGSYNGTEWGLPAVFFDIKTFHLNDKYNFDYHLLEKALIDHKPQCLLLGVSSYTQLLDYKKIRQLCDENNCFFISDNAYDIGLMMAGIIPHCFDDAHITIGSTYKTIKGPRGGLMISSKENCQIFQNHLTSLQVERGLNLVMASYLSIDHCFSEEYKLTCQRSLEIAQYIYNFFNSSELALFNVKPLMVSNKPMVLLDLGKDSNDFLKTMLECYIHISSFKIHDKYDGLKICTNNLTHYTNEEIQILLEQMKTIIICNININWHIKEKIKNNIKILTKKNICRKNNQLYEISYLKGINHEEIFKYIDEVIKKQNKRLVLSTACLFTQQCLQVQGCNLMALDLDRKAYDIDFHPYSPVVMKKTLHEKTNTSIVNHLKLTNNIWTYYSIPSATIAILAGLLTIINPDEKVLIVAENNGGHYSQGSVSGSGAIGLPRKLFKIQEFFINDHNVLDYDILEKNLQEFQPKVLLLGFSSYSGLLDYKKIRQICDKYNCYFISDCSHTIGLMLSGIIPHCFNDAHMTVASTYKTIPAIRGGFFITNNYDMYCVFKEKCRMFQGERGLNLVTCSYLGIQECFTAGYGKKINKAQEIVKFIENYFIKNQMGNPTVSSEIHMATIDCGFDVREIFPLILQCQMDIGTFYVPHTNRYGLRFICTILGALNYSLEDIEIFLDQLKIIFVKKNNITNEEKENIIKKIYNLTKKYPMFTKKEF